MVDWDGDDNFAQEVVRLRAELAEAHQRIERYEKASIENDAGWRAYRKEDAEEIARLTKERDQLYVDYHRISAGHDDLHDQRDEARDEIAHLREVIEQMLAETGHSGNSNRCCGDNRLTPGTVELARAAIDTLLSEEAKLRLKLESAEASIWRLTKRVNELRAECTELRVECAALQEALEYIAEGAEGKGAWSAHAGVREFARAALAPRPERK